MGSEAKVGIVDWDENIELGQNFVGYSRISELVGILIGDGDDVGWFGGEEVIVIVRWGSGGERAVYDGEAEDDEESDDLGSEACVGL